MIANDYIRVESHGNDFSVKLERAQALWQVVYDLLDHAQADIEAGRSTFEEDEAKTPEQYRLDDALRDASEVSSMRECAYEIVQAAIVMLGTE